MTLPFECWWDSAPELIEPRWRAAAAPYRPGEPGLGPFSGVTTNPMLLRAACALQPPPGRPRSGWDLYLACAARSAGYLRAEGAAIPLCVQLDPRSAFDAPSMLEQAAQVSERVPGATIKVPMTRAGLDVMAVLASAGVPINATWGFCVAQLVAAAEAMAASRPAGSGRAAPAEPGERRARHVITIMEGRIGDLALCHEVGREPGRLRAAECVVFDAAYASTRRYGDVAMLLASSLRAGPGGACWHYGTKTGREVIVTLPPSFLRARGLPAPGVSYGQADGESRRAALASALVRRYAEPDGFKPDDFDGLPPMVATHGEAVAAMAGLETMAGDG